MHSGLSYGMHTMPWILLDIENAEYTSTSNHVQVIAAPQLSKGYSFWLPVPEVVWRTREIAAQLPEYDH